METKYIALGVLAAGSLISAQASDIVVCDPANEMIFRFSDHDADNKYSGLAEISILLDYSTLATPSFNPDTAEMRVEGGKNVLYAVSDFPDGLYRCEDANGDGKLEAGEATFFFDAAAAFATVDPVGLEFTADGAIWLSSSYETARGLWRLEDLNADGDALDAGEAVQMVDGTAPFMVDTDLGAVSVTTDDHWRMAADGNAVIVYCGFSSSCINGSVESMFRFEDANSDGDVTDANESRLWLSFTNKNAHLPQHPDWATGTLRSMECNTQNLTSSDPDCLNNSNWARLNHLTSQDEGGTTVYYVASDSSSTSPYSTNVANLGLNGLVYRCIDGNGDGDVNDAGEVVEFLDASHTSLLSGNDLFDKIVGLDTADGWVYVADLVNGQRINRMRDMNGDGDAMDAGELEVDVWDFTSHGSNPPFPADSYGIVKGPFIEDIGAIAAGTWPAVATGLAFSGTACSQYGQLPVIGGNGQAKIGTANFTTKVFGAIPFQVAILMAGASDSAWLVPLPADMTIFGFGSGCSLYQSADVTAAVLTDAVGEAFVNIPIPNKASLVGKNLYLQWLVGNGTTGVPTTAFTKLSTLTIE